MPPDLGYLLTKVILITSAEGDNILYSFSFTGPVQTRLLSFLWTTPWHLLWHISSIIQPQREWAAWRRHNIKTLESLNEVESRDDIKASLPVYGSSEALCDRAVSRMFQERIQGPGPVWEHGSPCSMKTDSRCCECWCHWADGGRGQLWQTVMGKRRVQQFKCGAATLAAEAINTSPGAALLIMCW